MRFACALSIPAQGASAFRSTAVKADAFATALRNAPPKGPALPLSDSGECPSPLSFGPIPLQRRHRRRKRLDCRALGGCANPRRARGRVSCVAPSACAACAASPLQSFRPTTVRPRKRIRLGSQVTLTAHWQPPDAPACLRSRLPLARRPPCQHEVPTQTREDDDSSSEELAPNRSTHGFATQFAPHLRSTQRPESLALPPILTERDRWVEIIVRKRVVPALRDALKRRAATFDPTRCSELTPRGPARRRNTFGEAQPSTGIDHRSGARSLLTPSSCPKMLPPPRHPRSRLPANSLPTWNSGQRQRPEGHCCHRNPLRRADTRRPPHGGPPTPELTRSPKTRTPD
jgi:hypothetical protein